MSHDREPGWVGPDDEVRPGPTDLDTQLADLIVYCRAVTGLEEAAVTTAHAVLDSARSLLTDPDQLRAWLFALARMEILADAEAPALEVFDLVHRLGIRPEDLAVVLRIPPVEADELLAAAEEEYGHDGDWDDRPGWDDGTQLIEGQPGQPAVGSPGEMLDAQLAYLVAYCKALTGQEEDAASTAHAVLDSAQFLLTDPDRLRAWLFALARREMLADAAPDAQEILDLVHQHRIRAEDLPSVLGIPPVEADQLLAAAEEEYASTAFSFGHRTTDSGHSQAGHDPQSSDDRAAARDSSSGWQEGADWDEVFGPKSHRLQDLYGRIRKSPELAGRHAAPALGGASLRHVLSSGRARVAAATAIVVAVIGISAAFLAAANSPPPSQAGQQTRHHQAAVAQSPATTPSPAPTATPTQSPSPSQPVTVVLPPPPAPAPTSTKPKPSATPTSPTPTSPTPTSPTPTSPTPTSPTPTSPTPTSPSP